MNSAELPINEDLDQPDIQRYFDTDEQGTVTPLDPITGEALRAGVIPESLLADEELSKGYDYLNRNAERLQFGILLTPHGAEDDAEKAGVDLVAEARDLGDKHGVLFLEGVNTAHNRQTTTMLANYLSRLEGEEADVARDKVRNFDGAEGHGFTMTSLAAVTGSKAEVAEPDYEYGSDNPVDKALTDWYEALKFQTDKAVQAGAGGELREMDTYHSMKVGFVAYRDWYIVGKMGSYLAAREDDGENPVHAKLLVGTLHANIGRHLEGFGARVTYAGEHQEVSTPGADRIIRSVGNVAISQEERIDIMSDFIVAREKAMEQADH